MNTNFNQCSLATLYPSLTCFDRFLLPRRNLNHHPVFFLAGFPLTDVQLGSAFAVVTGHDVGGVQWSASTPTSTPSLVIIMGGRNLALICAEMQGVGTWPATTPVAVIKSAANPDMRIWLSTLGAVVADTQGERLSPCVIVVGGVVASAVARPLQFKNLDPQ